MPKEQSTMNRKEWRESSELIQKWYKLYVMHIDRQEPYRKIHRIMEEGWNTMRELENL